MNVKPKDDDDQMMGRKDDEAIAENNTQNRKTNQGKRYGSAGKSVNAAIEWNSYTAHFEKIAKESLVSAMENTLFQTQSRIKTDVLKRYTDSESRESFIKSITIQLMSTPEYQLC